VVSDGATLAVQGGISLPAAVMLGGPGAGSGGALWNPQGQNTLTGPITLTDDAQIEVDGGTLTVAGVISGNAALTSSGAGTLVLSGSNTFTGGLTVLSGTLSVPSVSSTGTAGPLGGGTVPVVLGGDTTPATLLYTGSGTTSNQAFTMGAGGGIFAVNSSLGLSGVIDGSGNLTMTGSGTLSLSGSNLYTGNTVVSGGTLAISGSGSINGTSGIFVDQGCLLQVTAGTAAQLPGTANLTLSGGSLSYAGNGSFGQLTGMLLLGPGQSNVAASSTGGSPYLAFAGSGPGAAVGATVNFSSSNCAINFQSLSPTGSGNIIGGYAFYNNADFAAVTATGSSFTVGALTSYTTGDLGTLTTTGTENMRPTVTASLTSSKSINSLNLTGSVGVSMSGGGALTLNSGGLIGNTTGNISGGTLEGSASGELVINTVQSLSIGSVIADNGGPTALVKMGPGQDGQRHTDALWRGYVHRRYLLEPGHAGLCPDE
jgi:autotransporter-associated beta strand protein